MKPASPKQIAYIEKRLLSSEFKQEEVNLYWEQFEKAGRTSVEASYLIDLIHEREAARTQRKIDSEKRKDAYRAKKALQAKESE